MFIQIEFQGAGPANRGEIWDSARRRSATTSSKLPTPFPPLQLVMPFLLYPDPGPVEETLNRLVQMPPVAPAADLLASLSYSLLYVACLPLTVSGLVLRAGHQYARLLLPWGGGNTPPGQEAIVITGCDSGFGYSTALELAHRGHTVFALCLSEESSQQLKAAAKEHNLVNLVRVICDVTRDSDVDAAVAVVDRWLSSGNEPSKPRGARRVRALVNNAGRGTPGLVDLLSLSEYEEDMSVNFFGVVRTTKAFLNLLKRSAQAAGPVPRILNIASMSGLNVVPGASAYVASKHAVVGFSKSIRIELAYSRISVSAICPTFHRTPLLRGLQAKFDLMWQLAGPAKRQEYGEAAHTELKQCAQDLYRACAWDPQNVTNAIVRGCVDPWAPDPVVRVGMDAKYVLGGVVAFFPEWLELWLTGTWAFWSYKGPRGAVPGAIAKGWLADDF
jgi:NAD(P)-dependent dehydrogenase (short-subunit alcohol dehydrogenase family)